MQYNYLGRSGLQVSQFSYGAWVTFGRQMGEGPATECMQMAYEAGVSFFDNAEVYASGDAETLMGKILEKQGWPRDTWCVSTKIFWGGEGPNQRGLSRKHIVEGTNAALKRLRVEYVDLIFCHRPDLHTPVEETVRAMNHVIDQGKAFYWGTSEWSAVQIMEAHTVARRENLIPPLMEQPQYNMLHRERFEKEYKRLYEEVGMGTTIWSPLAGGLLTGKYDAGEVPAGARSTLEGLEWLAPKFDTAEGKARLEKSKAMEPIAKELGCTRAQLALAWCAKNPNVSTVILGASKPEQLKENLAAQDVIERLTPEVMERIERGLDNRPSPEPDMR